MSSSWYCRQGVCQVAGILEEVRGLLWVGKGIGKKSDIPRHKELVLRCFFQSLGEEATGNAGAW